MSLKIDRAIGKTRKELVDYVQNCTNEELFEICDILNGQGIHATSWSCEECRKRFVKDGRECDGIEKCIEYFAEMDKTENI